MVYNQYPVHHSLKKLIRYYWSYDSNDAEKGTIHVRSFADKYPRLIFQDIENYAPIIDGIKGEMPICYLSGLDTRPSDGYWDFQFSHFGVSFYPHALHTFFGINASELTNQIPDIALIEKTDLPYNLLKNKNHYRKVAIMNRYFYDKVFNKKMDAIIDDLFLTAAPDSFEGENGIAKIADRYSISSRQLQRKFKENVGISARKYAKLSRFQKVLEQISNCSFGDLVSLSYEFNFFDQSHFIKDFKEFSGLSPYEFLKKNNLGSESASFIYKE